MKKNVIKLIASMSLVLLAMTICLSSCKKSGGEGGGDDEIMVTITFDANGGVGSMEPFITPQYGMEKLPKNTFVRENYDFIGWKSLDDDNMTFSDESKAGFGGDCTLSAQWSAK